MRIPSLMFVALVACACSSADQERTTASQQSAAGATMQVTTKSPEAMEPFNRGEALLNNLRQQEAVEAFDQALERDPDFMLARAFRGQATPGAEGLKQLESAAAMTSGVTDGERTLVEGLVAARRGEVAQSRAAYTKLTQIAPGDWRGHYYLGINLMNDQKYAEATQSLKKAAELNPQAGGTQNMLGYSALRQGDTDGAIAAFREYARVLPDEPNPQDSLGEALLAAGRFEEAEGAFRKAAEISPQFSIAWEGVAYAKHYAGDAVGARDALVKAREASMRAGDKAAADTALAAFAAAQNNTSEVQKALDAAEKTAGAQPTDVAFVPIIRAMTLSEMGRHGDALAQASTALQRADANQYPAGMTRNVRRQALRARITAEARMGDRAAAAKSSATLDADAASRPDDLQAQSAMHYGRGMLAVAQSDMAGARSHFEQCHGEDDYCKYQLVLAADKAGDASAAAAARDRLLKLYQREPVHAVIRAKLMPATARASSESDRSGRVQAARPDVSA